MTAIKPDVEYGTMYICQNCHNCEEKILEYKTSGIAKCCQHPDYQPYVKAHLASKQEATQDRGDEEDTKCYCNSCYSGLSDEYCENGAIWRQEYIKLRKLTQHRKSSEVGEWKNYQIEAVAAMLWHYDTEDSEPEQFNDAEDGDKAIYREWAEWALHALSAAKENK